MDSVVPGGGDKVRQLAAKAEGAPLPYRARYYARAGDACAAEGETGSALDFWGRAIDAYLQVARPAAAAALCRKVVERVPGVVRARCTLALLSIGQGQTDQALRYVEEYAVAARRAARTDLAVKLLHLMAHATEDARIRGRIAEILTDMGDAAGDVEPPAALAGVAGADADHRWAVILSAAHMSPADIAEL